MYELQKFWNMNRKFSFCVTGTGHEKPGHILKRPELVLHLDIAFEHEAQ